MIETVLAIVAIILALALAGVSLIAYRKSHIRAALYLIIAFLLMAIKKILEALHLAAWIERDISIAVGGLEVIVLLLFVLALWKR
ncbi:hypothetical protein E3E35_04665 [Thermococcus sp. GR7]|uniref:hypothetical protein n=1 Tax=unclassified Thermococcus TaxID=2627626 RepID=UPI0014321F8F|nr:MULTISPECIES: hypothetical protein [unclassified Thermococcus]NJE46718.1 hypothetical protein [Thermococcus sp. GR7]NJE77854.1 hypothetical protein [Thermococcus sp. GR4]NJF22982.1 hypothetical protein [Thermococcus sp. GR5]